MSRTELAILNPVAYAEAMEAHVRKETQKMALWPNQAEIDVLIAQPKPLPRPPRAIPFWPFALVIGVVLGGVAVWGLI